MNQEPTTPIKRDYHQIISNQQSTRNAASPASVSNTSNFMKHQNNNGGSGSGLSSSNTGTVAKRQKTIKFHDRFKGKIQMMSKEGHLGVVKTAGKPIEKVQPTGQGSADQSHMSGFQR